MKKVLVVFYSQSGQLKKILDSLLHPLQDSEVEIDYCPIKPLPDFPFPWKSQEFFDAFPESFMGIPCSLKPMPEIRHKNYDLIILGYSPWYLSPSIPTHAFLQSEEAAFALKEKKLITVIGCRNMWIMAQEKIKKYLKQLDAELVGNIALYDKSPNLVSVITIIRWLIRGKKEATRFFPASGVSSDDMARASEFGKIIKEALSAEKYEYLQSRLNDAGAVNVKPNLLLFERNGSKIFRMWASKILAKGPYGDHRRKWPARMFKYYLLVVLFVVSPLANLVYSVIKLFISKKIKQQIRFFSQNQIED